MSQITLTLDLSDPKTKAVLLLLADQVPTNEPEVVTAVPVTIEVKEKQPKKQVKAKEKETVSEEKPAPEVNEPVVADPVPEEKVPTKLEVRAAALRLSKNGRSEELKKIFETYGAVNLSTLAEKDYASAISDMEAVQI